MMTDRQITLIQSSFQKVIVDIDETAHLFYQRVFELRPDISHLFKEDIQVQGRKLIKMLLFIVNHLHDDDADVTEQLSSLGKRHVAYHVKDDYFDVVRDALMWTLQRQLQEDFTRELHQAWLGLYGEMTEIMTGISA